MPLTLPVRNKRMKIRYYRIAQFIYRVFDDLMKPQQLIEGIGWIDSRIFQSEAELVISGAQPIQAP